MKAIILATGMSLAYGLITTLVFRSALPTRRAWWMLWIFVLTLVPLVGLHIATAPDLGFLPDAWVERYAAIDLAYTVFIFSVSFFGGWLQLYNLADRGLSLRMLIDAHRHAGRIDENSIVLRYSDDRGLAWMYQKRLDDLTRLGLIQSDGRRITVTKKGLRYAQLFAWCRRFYGLQQNAEGKRACPPA